MPPEVRPGTSYGYPQGSDDEHPPPLTQETFDSCFLSIAIYTPGPIDSNGNILPPPQLLTWYNHATDGDLTILPCPHNPYGQQTPGDYLMDACKRPMQRATTKVSDAYNELDSAWTGPASVPYHANLRDMRDQLGRLTNDGEWLDQAANLLNSAYQVQVAFKKDLYAIGQQTYTSAHAQYYEQGSTTGEVGLMLVGVGLSAIGALVSASGNPVIGSMVSTAGSYAFGQATQKIRVGGDSEDALMDSLDQAVRTAIGHYENACMLLGQRMDTLWGELNEALKTPPEPPPVTQGNYAPNSLSFQQNNFFPASGQGSR